MTGTVQDRERVIVEADLLRADWRFLLPLPPSGTFEHLVLLGGPDGLDQRLLTAGTARSVSRTLTSQPADAVVLLGGDTTLAQVEHAAHVLNPGGALYCEIIRRRPASLWMTPTALARSMQAASLTPTGLYWPVPGLSSYKRQIPLDVPGALPWYYATMFAPGTRAQHLLENGSRKMTRGFRSSLVSRVVPWYAATAIAGRHDQPAPSLLGAPGFPAELRPPGTRPFLLTSGVDDGSRVVVLPFGPASTSPEVVLKAARSADFNTNVEGEQRTLTELRSNLDASLRHTVPTPLGTYFYGDLAVGMETCARGRSLFSSNIDCRVPAREKIDNLRQAAHWLTRFHEQTQRQGSNRGAGVFIERAAEYFERFSREFAATDAEQRLLSGVLERAQALTDRRLPLVWQHNDYGPWNVYRDGAELTVIDWEIGWGPGFDRVGPPVCDMLYLVTHWSYSARRLFSPAAEIRGFHQLFLAPERADIYVAAAREVVFRYVDELRIDREFLPLLLVYTWVERAVKRLERKRLLRMNDPTSRSGDQFVAYVHHLAAHADPLFAGFKP